MKRLLLVVSPGLIAQRGETATATYPLMTSDPVSEISVLHVSMSFRGGDWTELSILNPSRLFIRGAERRKLLAISNNKVNKMRGAGDGAGVSIGSVSSLGGSKRPRLVEKESLSAELLFSRITDQQPAEL